MRTSAVNVLMLYQEEDIMNTKQEINATLKALANSASVGTSVNKLYLTGQILCSTMSE